MCDRVFGGAGKAGGPMSPAAIAWVLPDTELQTLPGFGPRATELAEAKKLLSAAGFPNGFDAKVLTVTAFNADLLNEVIVGNLKEIGVNLTTENIGTDFSVFLGREIAGDFELASTLFLSGPYPDAQLLLYHHSTKGSRNYDKYSNGDMDAKLEKQSTIYNTAERKAQVLDIQRELIKNPGPVWAGSRILIYVIGSNVQNATGGGAIATPFLNGYGPAEDYYFKKS